MTLLIAAALAACSLSQETPDLVREGCRPSADQWRTLATEGDRERMRDWRAAWDRALAEARAAGHSGEIEREGALLQPDAALAGPTLPEGDYDCRTIKLGSRADDGLFYVAYPAFRCRVRIEDGIATLTKLTGSQRPIGRLYGDMDRRMIFLGTMQLGDERRAYRYGTDRERDMIGLLERIGERRWRLVFPSPRFESELDVIELTPR